MKRLKQKLRSKKAFTLMEMVITIMLVTMVGVGVIIYSLNFAQLERERMSALALAGEKMEEIKRPFIFTLTSSIESVTIDDSETPNDPDDDVVGTMQVVLRDESGNLIVGSPPDDRKVQVEIIVSWHPGGRLSTKQVNERLITFITP